MRVLLLDQGNSLIKAAWRGQGDELLELRSHSKPDSLLAEIQGIPDSIWLSSVVAQADRDQLVNALRAKWGCAIHQVSVARYVHHLPTDYAVEQLGVDRWLAVLACARQSSAPALVVDTGTATTVDLLEQGRHLGGYILPGFQLMNESLLGATAIQVSGRMDTHWLPPRDTISAVGMAGPVALAAMLREMRQDLGADCRLVLGGGGASEQLQPLLGGAECRDQLVLQGIAVLSNLEGV